MESVERRLLRRRPARSRSLYRLSVSPHDGLADEPLEIRFEGAPPGERVTIRVENLALAASACATFRMVEGGVLDLSRERPESGDYDWADASGLLCALRVTGQSSAGPYERAHPRRVFRAEGAGVEVARTEISRHWFGPGVRRSPVRERGLVGVLYEPDGPGPHPALVVLGGSGGGLNEPFACMLASRGYVALALAYFGLASLPPSLVEIPLEYFDTALDWLCERAGVARDRLGVVGASRGGELSLLLAATFPRISVAVAYVPSHVVWAGFGADPSVFGKSAWTHRGTPLSCLGSTTSSPSSPPQQRPPLTGPAHAFAGSSSFLSRLDDGPAEEKAAIRLENSDAAFLLISGGDDQMWPSAEFARRAIGRLEAHGHPRPYRHLSYPRAGHAIGLPCVPHATEIVHPVNGWRYALGGTPEANAWASRDSWQKLLEFLREHH